MGAAFCETCGQPLLAADSGPATADIPVLDYADVSFADLILSAGEHDDRKGSGHGPGALGGRQVRADDPAPGGREPPLPTSAGSGAGPATGTARSGFTSPGPADEGLAGGGFGGAGSARGARRAVPPRGGESGRSSARGAGRAARVAAVVLATAAVAAGVAHTLRGRPSPALASQARQRGGAQHPVKPSASPAPSLPGLRAGASGWTAPAPVGALPPGAVISGLDCPQASACFAVDSAGDVLTSSSPGAWRVVATDSHRPLVAIDCASARFCVALDSTGGAMIDSGGVWGSPVYVDNRSGAFTAVSCPTTQFCLATDSGGNAFAYDGATGAWTASTVDTLGSALTGVSCASADHCVAVDSDGGVYTYTGRSWTSAPATVDVGHAFTAVSCASTSFCAAIDNTGGAAVLSGGTWTVGPLGTTAEAVACPAAGQCEAVDDAGAAAAYANGAWSQPTGIDGQVPFDALSCPAADFCVAADHSGDVLYYAPSR